MPSITEDFIAEKGLGRVERRIRLGGRLDAAGASELTVELCLTDSGAWLVAAAGRFVGTALDAGDPATLRYERGSLRDRLLLGERALTVPTGRAGEVRRLIAKGRLRRRGPPGALNLPSMPPDRYLEKADELCWEFVSSLQARNDCLIALLVLGESDSDSALGCLVSGTRYFTLSAEHARIFSISELGDTEIEELDLAALKLEPRAGGSVLCTSNREVSVAPKQQALLSELIELGRLPAPARLREAARRLRVISPPSERVANLVAEAVAREDAIAGVVELALAAETARPPPAAASLAMRVSRLRAANVTPEALRDAITKWQFRAAHLRELVSRLASMGEESEPYALFLHRSARVAQIADKNGADESLALWDIELAEHELSAGEGARARTLAETRLRTLLPDEDAVLAPERATRAHVERQRLYEILCREAELRGNTDVPALAALARLEPTRESRLTALSRAQSDHPLDQRLVERATHVLACLAPGGLDGSSQDGPTELPVPLARETLDQSVRHPLARRGRLAARLSELVATVPEPDLSFLRDFCEELAPARHADAARALGRATALLGLDAVSAYISHGARSIGLRAFGAKEPFVLIGASHLDADNPYALRGNEFDFALGAELAHLAFGHQRVTAGEVWAGAAGKTRDMLLALGVMLPIAMELGGPRAQRILGKLSRAALDRAAEGAAKLPDLMAHDADSESLALGKRNEELIAAHRLVQLTADRAGLVAARDLKSALRALLLTRAEYRPVLDDSRTRGLVAALAQRRAESPAISDLLVRVRALAAFYLSPEFDQIDGRERR